MANKNGYFVRLRVRLGKPLTSDEPGLKFNIGGQEIELKSQKRDEPIRNSTWILMIAKGFETEAEAKRFGEHLGVSLEMAALANLVGVDVGQGEVTSWINEEYLRKQGVLGPEQRIRPNIHGLAVYPDDGNSLFFLLEAEGDVTSDPAAFIDTIAEMMQNDAHLSDICANSIRILNQALISNDHLAKATLAFSAVEVLGQNENWSSSQRSQLEQLARNVEANASEGDKEALEIATALRRGLHRLGLRQGVMRIIDQLGQKELRKDWDRLYGIRSGIIHGTGHLPENELAQFASDALLLCGKIVLAMSRKEGAYVPTACEHRFSLF